MAVDFGLQIFSASGRVASESDLIPSLIFKSDLIEISGISGEIYYPDGNGAQVYMHIFGYNNFNDKLLAPIYAFGSTFSLYSSIVSIPLPYPVVVPTPLGGDKNKVYWENPIKSEYDSNYPSDREHVNTVFERIRDAKFSVRLFVAHNV